MGTVDRVRARTVVVSLGWAAWLLACGCRTYLHEVGSTHVAVLSVTSWEAYAEQLAPHFDVSADALRSEAVAETLQFEEAIVRAFTARLGLSLPGTAGGAGTPATPAAASPGTITLPGNAINRTGLGGDRFLEYQAATALYQEVKLLNRYVLDAARRDGYGAYIVRMQVTNMPHRRDRPFDTYANLAFYMDPVSQPAEVKDRTRLVEAEKGIQERVKGIGGPPWPSNGGLTCADWLKAVRKEAEKRRVEITEEMRNKGCPEGVDAVQVPCEELKRVQMYDRLLADIDATLAELQRPRLPVVVPLLVTDQVEAALVSRRVETLRQLALSLAVMYSGQGAKLEIEDIDRAMRSALGRDYNSLFTVARLADNALRVRIGARQAVSVETNDPGQSAASQPHKATYETVPQTHNVTVLLLVPPGEPSQAPREKEVPIYLGLRTEYRDPRSGRAFPVEKGSAASGVRSLLAKGGYGQLPTGLDDAKLDSLVEYAQNGRYKDFLATLAPTERDRPRANRLWLDLIGAHVGSDYDVTEFAVPASTHASMELSVPEGAEVFLLDDGSATTARLNGVRNLDPSTISAIWEWRIAGEAEGRTRKLAASAVSLNGPRQLVLTFPSLLGNGLARPGQEVEGRITLSRDSLEMPPFSAHVTLAKSPEPNHVEILATTDAVTMAGGAGTVDLWVVASGPAVTRPKEVLATVKDLAVVENLVTKRQCFLLTVDGVDADPTPGSEQVLVKAARPGCYVIVGTGKVTFTLKNPGTSGKARFAVTAPIGSDAVAGKEFTLSASSAGTKPATAEPKP